MLVTDNFFEERVQKALQFLYIAAHPHPFIKGGGLVLISLFGFLFVLSSCSGLKKSTTETRDKTKRDTGKVGAVSCIDSITNSIGNTVGKIGEFFGNLIPGSGGKDSVILVPPPIVQNPAANPFEPPSSGGFLSTPVKRQIVFDSLGNATIRDVVSGADIHQPLSLSLSDFLKLEEEGHLETEIHESAQKYTSSSNAAQGNAPPGAASGKLSGPGILSDYGHIDIPIPPSIVPTIFGRPSINLRVNGDVAIHLAYRDNQFLATTGALFNGSETGLDFKQEVNMNITGSIGDKIKINTDFGSLRQFSFDNIFKLSYQGFPDEIIQSIEAGDVTLKTPSKYIGIQSALFGFKSVMRFGPLYFTALAAQKKGEHQSKSFGGGPGSTSGNDFVIQPANYRKNSYFLDSTFIQNYEPFYSQVPNTSAGDVVVRNTVEVWRSTVVSNEHRVSARAYYSSKLPPIPIGTRYDPTYKNNLGQNNSGP